MKVTLKERFDSGHFMVGTWVQIPSPENVEIVGANGFEFVLIDGEHSYPTSNDVVSMIRAAEVMNLPNLVRVPEISEGLIKIFLDAGASGIVIPNVKNVEQAKQVIQYAKFPPLGKRGACPYVRANFFGAGDIYNYYEKQNKETTVMFLLESVESIDNMEEIVKLEGADVFMLGVVDLSVDMGIPGQTSHPDVIAAVNKLSELTKKYGKYNCIFCTCPQDAIDAKKRGERIFVYGCDTIVLNAGYKNVYESITSQL